MMNKLIRKAMKNIAEDNKHEPAAGRVVIEELMVDPSGDLKDYKFFCYHGEPKYVQVDGGRLQSYMRDAYGNKQKKIPVEYGFDHIKQVVSKPGMFDKMLELVKKLSRDFTFVRVDLYCTGIQLLFGELTFTPGIGQGRFSNIQHDQSWAKPSLVDEYVEDRLDMTPSLHPSKKKSIIIYRDHLLAPSETFIKSQAEGLQSYQSYFVGSRAIKGLDIEPDRKFLINRGESTGRMKEILFKLTGSAWSAN